MSWAFAQDTLSIDLPQLSSSHQYSRTHRPGNLEYISTSASAIANPSKSLTKLKPPRSSFSLSSFPLTIKHVSVLLHKSSSYIVVAEFVRIDVACSQDLEAREDPFIKVSPHSNDYTSSAYASHIALKYPRTAQPHAQAHNLRREESCPSQL